MTTIDFSTLERLHRVYLNTAAKTKAMRTEIIETLIVGEPLHPSWKQVVTKVLYSSKTVVYSSFSSPAKFLYFSCPQLRMICTSIRTFWKIFLQKWTFSAVSAGQAAASVVKPNGSPQPASVYEVHWWHLIASPEWTKAKTPIRTSEIRRSIFLRENSGKLKENSGKLWTNSGIFFSSNHCEEYGVLEVQSLDPKRSCAS